MTIDQVEARVAASLHASDELPVDRAAGWAGLQERMETPPRRRGRVLAIAAAAAVLIAGAVPLLLDRDSSRTAPPVRPAPAPVTISPSGLPVGLLKAPLDLRANSGLQAQLWLVVRPDGTGSFRLWSIGEGIDETNEVRLVARGPGTVRILSDSVSCRGPEVLTLGYERTGARVTFVSVDAPGTCLVSSHDAAALTGLTVPVRPLPAPADQ